MAAYDSVENVKVLSQIEINKMTNPQLKRALLTMVNNGRDGEPSNSILLDELRSIKQDLAEVKNLKQEVQSLSDRLDEAYTIIHYQQLFMESLDSKERRRNLVITGLTENTEDDMGESDNDKVVKVLQAAGYSGTLNSAEWQMKRLGQVNQRRARPLLVTQEDQGKRDAIIRCARNLKEAEEPLKKVFIKKDIHPAVRKENGRLKAREREEKEKPENAGVNIVYDWKKRVLLREGMVIDRFSPRFF